MAERSRKARPATGGARRRRRLLAAVVGLQLTVAILFVVLRSPGSSDVGEPAAPAAPPEEALVGNQAQLTGVVSGGAGKEPIEGAVLSIDHAGGLSTVRTGADGRYRTVVDASRPIGFTVDAPGYRGLVAFGRLCPGERRTVTFVLQPATDPAAPAPPLVLEERVCR